jgi:16S rRNA G1207 methylase RsmC
MDKLTPQQLEKLRLDHHLKVSLSGQQLEFFTTWGLFSPRAIDEGSSLLLDVTKVNVDDDVLDLGCGYGALGLCLAKQAHQGSTLLVDKDFVAVDYSNKNIKLNQLKNAEAILSNGFDQIPKRKFDLIVSNIPAKVGNEMLWLFLHDAYRQLNPGGRLVVVTISGLSKFMKREFKQLFGNYKKLKQGKTYTVAQTIR